METAPIVLFTYNRVSDTRNLLQSLLGNELSKKSTLYIYSDGPKPGASEQDIAKVNAVRDFVRTKQWCKEVHIIEAESNMGCGPSIIRGVTEIVNKHGRVIVLEDDLNLSPFFLDFMNDALNVYENTANVSSIGACNFFACGPKFPSTFFIQYPDCLGWATWADRWRFFEADASKLLEELRSKNLIPKFNSEGAFDMEALLIAQINDHVSAWDIQWTATCILKNWYSLYPNLSLTQHLYKGGDATHSHFEVLPPLQQEKLVVQKTDVEILPHVYQAMKLGYQKKSDFYGNKIEIKKDQTYYLNKLREVYYPLRAAFKKLKNR
ncbi:hypothetical protein [Pedobacter sp.]|uniref:hypothetical protein n=1 Tax=Pedobacter sp. TaxID=1411316 RepID=UPI0031E022D6